MWEETISQLNLNNEFKQIIRNKCDSIVQSIYSDIRHQQPGSYKIFIQRSEKKSDINRMIREKHFIKSIYNKSYVYEQPKMSKNIRRISHDRHTSQYFEEQQDLRIKAEDFVRKLHNKKRQYQGRIHLIRRAQKQKQCQIEKRKQIQSAINKEMIQKTRKLKAQRNIQFFNQKKQIYLKHHSNSTSPIKRRLSLLSSDDQQKRQSTKSPSHFQDELQQIQEEQSELLPIGVNNSKRQSEQAENQGDFFTNPDHLLTEQQSDIRIQLQKVGHRNPQGRIHFQRKRMSIKREFPNKSPLNSYVINRDRGSEYSEYIDNYTKEEDLKPFLKPERAWSQRTDQYQSQDSSVTKNSHRFFKSSISQRYSEDSDFLKIKMQLASEIYADESSLRRKTENIQFPLLQKTKTRNKRLRTLSTIN